VFETNRTEVTSLLNTLKEISSGSGPNMHFEENQKIY